MPGFRYTALSADQTRLTGTLDAADVVAATRWLRDQGHLPLNVRPLSFWERGGTGRGGGAAWQHLCDDLAGLLGHGVALDDALDLAGADHPGARALAARLLGRVRAGLALSEALANEPGVTAYHLALLRAGEASGSLGQSFTRLAAHLAAAAALRAQLISALTYPALLLVVAVISLSIVLGVVVPQFRPLFANAGNRLPAATRLVLDFSDGMRQVGPFLLLLPGAAWIGLRLYAAAPARRIALSRMVGRIPVLGPTLAAASHARLARTLGSLLESRVPLLDALALTRDTIGSPAVAQALGSVIATVRTGVPLHTAFAQTGLFPASMVHILRLGGETGQVDATLLRLADRFDAQLRDRSKRLLALLEPALIVTLGVIVGAIVVAILSGLLSINSLAVGRP